jgi:hypothetical protein
MSRKQREDDRRKIACVERDPIWAVYSKAKHVLPPQHVQELEARRMDHLPHGITRDGTYMFMRKDAWTVCDGVAYQENNWTVRREFDERQYQSIGYLNYMALTKMVQTISDGPARDTLETVLRKERWYWGRRKTERESRKAYKKVMGMVLLGNGKIGVYRH